MLVLGAPPPAHTGGGGMLSGLGGMVAQGKYGFVSMEPLMPCGSFSSGYKCMCYSIDGLTAVVAFCSSSLFCAAQLEGNLGESCLLLLVL